MIAARALRFDSFVVDLTRRALLRDGVAVELRPRSFDVLALLAERAGAVVPREAFFDQVWAGLAVSDESLSRCISDVRAALDDRRQQLVKTVPGRGYVLAVAPVATSATPVTSAASAVSATSEGSSLPGGRDVARLAATPAPSSTPPATSEAAVDAGGPSIAVLPFLELGGRPDEQFLADGFTEDITSALSRVRGLMVIARSTMFTFKGQAVDVRALGTELGVRYVLEGSVRKAGPRLRVSAQLIEATSGAHLWAENYDRVVDELFAIQDEIATQIAGRIGPEVWVAEFGRASRKATQSLSAWECVIRALQHATQQSEPETRAAQALLERALAHDPQHAQALGMTAWLEIFRAFQGWQPMPQALAKAEEAIARGLAADNEELWPYLASGMVGFATRDNVRSMAALERAAAISPSSVNAHGLLCVAHAFGGRADEALAEITIAMRLSPRDTYLSDFDLYQAFAYFQAARYELTLRHAEQAVRLRPGHPYPLVLAASSAGHLGGTALGRRHVERLRAVMPVASCAWVEATTPYVREEDRRRLAAGLALAGLPLGEAGPARAGPPAG